MELGWVTRDGSAVSELVTLNSTSGLSRDDLFMLPLGYGKQVQ